MPPIRFEVRFNFDKVETEYSLVEGRTYIKKMTIVWVNEGEPHLSLHFYEVRFYRGEDGIDVRPLQGFEVPTCVNPVRVVPLTPDGVVINPPHYAR
ncbi:hypothetical protein NL676_030088 [Syzygium grande]|nr:hypothetical protein NL676_030088 [Syzygium grande]